MKELAKTILKVVYLDATPKKLKIVEDILTSGSADRATDICDALCIPRRLNRSEIRQVIEE